MSKKNSNRLQIEYRSPHELRPRSDNAKVHSKQQIKKIAKSIERFGFVNPVLISDENEIIGGHGRVEAAKVADLPLIPTVRLSSLTPAERLAYNLADNRLVELARYDRDLLAVQLDELTKLGFDEIEVTGFSLADIDLRLGEAAEKKGDTVSPDDELPAPRKNVVSRRGDRWLLGSHRLLCGDATVAADCQRLMDGQQADMVLTDPPWNLPTRYFSGRGRHRHPNFVMAHGEKSEGEFIDFLATFFAARERCIQAGRDHVRVHRLEATVRVARCLATPTTVAKELDRLGKAQCRDGYLLSIAARANRRLQKWGCAASQYV